MLVSPVSSLKKTLAMQQLLFCCSVEYALSRNFYKRKAALLNVGKFSMNITFKNKYYKSKMENSVKNRKTNYKVPQSSLFNVLEFEMYVLLRNSFSWYGF